MYSLFFRHSSIILYSSFFIFMSLTLRHNLTSDYLDAARRLSPPKKRRRIVAYVES